jgi:hypothetical protein
MLRKGRASTCKRPDYGAASVPLADRATLLRPTSILLLHTPTAVCVAPALLLLAIAGCNCLGCSAPSSATATEHVVAENVREKDLGKLMQGEDIKHTFEIRNTTGRPFTVTDIHKSCGCQAAELQVGAVVPAGEILRIPYTVPGTAPGERIGRLVISTDAADASFKEITLSLRATIQPQLWASPQMILFGTVADGESPERELRVESTVPGLLESYQGVRVSRGNVTAALQHRTPETLHFLVKYSSTIPRGEIHDLISFSFADPAHPSLNVLVRAYKGARFAVIPKTTTLSPFLNDAKQTLRVRLMSLPQGKFRIQRVECEQGIAVSELPSDARHAFDLTITFTRPAEPRSRSEIVFHTEPPGSATMVVAYAANDLLSP